MNIYKQFSVYERESLNIYLRNALANKSGKSEINIASVSNAFCSKYYRSQNGDGQINGMCSRQDSRGPKVAHIRISVHLC